jgi:hypothetical protein
VPISSVVPWPKNPRGIKTKDFDRLKKQIKKLGEYKPLIAYRENGHYVVLGGNMRLRAYQELGIQEVEISIIKPKSEAQKIEYALSDNDRVGYYEEEALAELVYPHIKDIDLGEFKVDLGEPIDLKQVVERYGPDIDDGADEVPEVDDTPAVTKTGDLFTLGRHRVMCGDSTKAEDVARLMRGEKADLCFTSPPYALGKSVALSGNKAMSAKKNAYANHSDDAESWAALMDGWYEASIPFCASWVVNVQPLAGNKRALVSWMAKHADRLVDIATWDKGHAAPPAAQGVMASRYEWLVILAGMDATRVVPFSSWLGTVQSVYSGPPQRHNDYSEIHAATMPIHLAEWVQKVLCDKATSVLDPFLGSGTTLIAAEKLNRTCYGMEIDPKYCDVIIKRYCDYAHVDEASVRATREGA